MSKDYYEDYIDDIADDEKEESTDSKKFTVDEETGVLIYENPVVAESLVDKEEAKLKEKMLKAEAKRIAEERLKANNPEVEEGLIITGIKGGGRRRGNGEASEKKLYSIVNTIQDETEEIIVPALDSSEIDPLNVEHSRNTEFEREFGRKFDILETVLADMEDNEDGKRWKTDADILKMLDYINYIFGFNYISQEIYKTRTKNIVKELLLTKQKIANYRYPFIENNYDALLALIPKHIVVNYSEEYLKDTFILINIIYKFAPESMTLDIDELVSIILEKNEILPAQDKYNEPYTREFLINLSQFGIFTHIQNMCLGESSVQQALALSAMFNDKLAQWKESGQQNTQDMKSAADALDKLDKIAKSNKLEVEENKDAIVYRVAEKGLDYSKFAKIIPYNTGIKRDRVYQYYIVAFETTKEGKRKFYGYVQNWEADIARERIVFWEDVSEVAKLFAKLERETTIDYLQDRKMKIGFEVYRKDVEEYSLDLAEKFEIEEEEHGE